MNDRVPAATSCQTCRGELDVPGDPATESCGGDCLRCMATVWDDPDCVAALAEIERVREKG